MPLPRVGEVIDGYRYAGGDPNQKGSWEWAGDDGPALGGAYDAVSSSKKYRDTLAAERAKDDIKRLQDASQGARDAYGMEGTADRGLELLKKTPVGPAADLRITLGRAVGGTPLSMLPGIPDREQTANLETFRTIGSQGALGDVSKLKGPLSEKELAFIRRMQADPAASYEYNKRVLEAQKWAARRQAAYGTALRRWTTNLGSPSALNPKGQSFDDWWGSYAGQAIPQPGLERPKPAPAAPTAKPGQKAAYRILSVE